MKIKDKQALTHTINTIFSKVQYKIKGTLVNNSNTLLPTDVLTDGAKQDLFRVASLTIESLVFRLGVSSNYSKFEDRESKALLLALIKISTEEFLSVSYGCHIPIQISLIKDSFYTKTILNEYNINFTLLLDIIYNSESPLFKLIFFPVYDEITDNFTEIIIDNLIVEITNAVAYFIVYELSKIQDLRKTLYRSNFLSLRNSERFKNNLGWQTRLNFYVKLPTNLYSSQHCTWIIRTTGIYSRTIYANRSTELQSLRNLSLLTVVGLEGKDFLMSRADETIYFVGSSFRYTLTSVLGQVIALVWRGIIEGLKN